MIRVSTKPAHFNDGKLHLKINETPKAFPSRTARQQFDVKILLHVDFINCISSLVDSIPFLEIFIPLLGFQFHQKCVAISNDIRRADPSFLPSRTHDIRKILDPTC